MQAVIKKMEDDLAQEIAKRQAELDAKIAEMEKNEATVEEINQLRGNFVDEEAKLKDELLARHRAD